MEHVVFTLSWLMVLSGCIGVWGGGRSVGVLVCVWGRVSLCVIIMINVLLYTSSGNILLTSLLGWS